MSTLNQWITSSCLLLSLNLSVSVQACVVSHH
ncbi:hypothetical protein [Klebsiella phage pKP-BM327-1.1]|nr:hypothetical protein [Klebsiella phage pKP-BM327-1.1]